MIAGLLCALVAGRAQAQGTSVQPELASILRGLASEDWRAREAALQALHVSVQDVATASKPVADALVALLHTETLVLKRARVGSLSEAYTEHLADVLATVAGMPDRRTIPDLIEHMGRGSMVTNGLAAFGGDALPQILKASTEPTEAKRSYSLLVLSAMLESRNAARVTGEDRATIKAALLRGAVDDARSVRMSAIQGLEKIPGDDVTALLKKIAESDPFVVSTPGKPPVYPVRHVAAEALQKRSK